MSRQSIDDRVHQAESDLTLIQQLRQQATAASDDFLDAQQAYKDAGGRVSPELSRAIQDALDVIDEWLIESTPQVPPHADDHFKELMLWVKYGRTLDRGGAVP